MRRLIHGFLAAWAFAVAVEASTALSSQTIGTAEKVVGQVYGQSLLREMQVGEELVASQRVRTGVDSAADLRFLDQTHLVVGSRTEVVLDEFVYNPNQNSAQGLVNVVRGVLRFASPGNALDVAVKTRTATIGVRGTVFDVLASPQSTEIAVYEGRVEVDSPYGSAVVNAGEVLTVSAASGDLTAAGEASGRMRTAVSSMLALVGSAAAPDADTEEPVESRSSAATQPEQSVLSEETAALIQEAARGIDLENLLYLDLAYGRVIIETRPDLAPQHVARIKELTRARFYDGLTFHSVVPELAAQAGDPTGTGRGGSGTELAAEFSEQSFLRGSVGMRRERQGPDTADSQFFICFEDCPQFDGRYTFWGQVIFGMDFVDQLHPGNPPREPDEIIRMRVAADVTG